MIDKEKLFRAEMLGRMHGDKGSSSAYIEAVLYSHYGAYIGIGYCEMIADAYGAPLRINFNQEVII